MRKTSLPCSVSRASLRKRSASSGRKAIFSRNSNGACRWFVPIISKPLGSASMFTSEREVVERREQVIRCQQGEDHEHEAGDGEVDDSRAVPTAGDAGVHA